MGQMPSLSPKQQRQTNEGIDRQRRTDKCQGLLNINKESKVKPSECRDRLGSVSSRSGRDFVPASWETTACNQAAWTHRATTARSVYL